uniref:Uncharacterized protein n=1 Tax=Sphaerodactylus townsendi TaxID=933632 RepID=A0ACB8G6Y9_9SAUR
MRRATSPPLIDAEEAPVLLLPELFSSLPPLNNENAGARSNPAENPPVQVNGILGGSASFPLKLPATTPVARIEWSLRAGSGPEVLIPELKVGRLEWQDTRERFGQRLEMADGTTLRIRALEKEDSCTLEARVVFASGEVLRKTFRLSVFEPVPDPEIHPHLVSRSTEVCNVTLHCLGSEKGGIDVSWKRGNSSDQLGVPEEGLDTDLHVSWQSSSLDSTFTCLLSNPADQKSASLDLASICRSEDGGHLMYMWILGLVAFLILVAGLGIWQWKKRPRPREMLIAELRDGKLEWQNTWNPFRQRLEMADETTLRIRALEKEDGCTLEALVVFASVEVLRQTFRLSVFEPVPDPEIRPHLVSRTAEVCNVTLHCLGSEKGGIEVSWKRGNSSDQPGVPEEGSDADLHVSWGPDSLDSTFTCLLSNPTGQKSASLDLTSICRSEDDGHPVYVWILGLVAFLILVAGVGFWLWKKRPCPRGHRITSLLLNSTSFPLTKPVKRDPPEYAAVQKKKIPQNVMRNRCCPLLRLLILGRKERKMGLACCTHQEGRRLFDSRAALT